MTEPSDQRTLGLSKALIEFPELSVVQVVEEDRTRLGKDARLNGLVFSGRHHKAVRRLLVGIFRWCRTKPMGSISAKIRASMDFCAPVVGVSGRRFHAA